MAIIISRTIHGNTIKDGEELPDLTENPEVIRTLEQVFGRIEREYESESGKKEADKWKTQAEIVTENQAKAEGKKEADKWKMRLDAEKESREIEESDRKTVGVINKSNGDSE